MYSRENYNQARAEIEERRHNAVETANERNRALAEESPEIAKIDDELSKTGLLLLKVACDGGDIDTVRRRNEELMQKRGALLESLGYPSDYTTPHYTCKFCSDSGFIDTKMCVCLKQLLITKNIKSSGMGHLIEKQSFDNFDLDFYRGNREQYDRMAANVRIARSFAANFAKKRGNLLIIGNTGTGKTHISTAIAKDIISQGYDVLYDSVQNILSDFETDKFRSGYNTSEQASEKYLECELLIIDDLGTEFITQFSISALYNLLNTRQNKGLSTIISTNLSAPELAARYEGRIYSRIVGSDYTVLKFEGKDHRIG